MKLKTFCRLLVCGMLGVTAMAADGKKTAARETLRIMTYNIHAGYGMDGKLDNGRILQVIRNADPDFGGLNEVDYGAKRSEYTDIVAEIRTNLKMSSVFAQAIPMDNPDRGPGGYGVAAFAKKNIYVMQQFALPVPVKSEPRTALILRVQQAKPVYLVVTHLPWEETEDMKQVRILCFQKIEQILKENHYYPAILTGDMNALPDSPEITYLRKNWTVCNDLHHQKSWPADKPTMELDYIAFMPRNAFRTVKTKVITEKIASDHRPLVVELERIEK